jgi:hypothetical protein
MRSLHEAKQLLECLADAENEKSKSLSKASFFGTPLDKLGFSRSAAFLASPTVAAANPAPPSEHKVVGVGSVDCLPEGSAEDPSMRGLASLADSLLLAAQRSRALNASLRKTCVDVGALAASYSARTEQARIEICFLFVCLFVCLFACLFVCLFVCLFLYLFVRAR